jgi:NADH-quinone oxidoreductase subunit E
MLEVACACANQPAENSEEARLREMLEKYKNQKGVLIPALQETQKLFGYLPEAAMEQIARTFGLPLSQVYGVATFYAQFHLKPRGRHVIRVCQGTACHVRGSSKILDRVKQELGIDSGETTADLRYTIEPVACIGACGLAPVMMINDDTHGRLTPEMMPRILAKYE